MRTNKRAKQITEQYERATATRLSDVYGRCSEAKQRAFNYCHRLMQEYNGDDMKILSHNTFVFTAAFLFEDQETGAINIMRITPSKNEAVEWTM